MPRNQRKSKSNTINLVPQEEQFGCAVACIATVLGKTYDEISQTFENDFSVSGINLAQAIEYLGDAGYSIVHKYVTHYNNREFARKYMLTPFAPIHIVRIMPRFDSANGHLVIMDYEGTLHCPAGIEEKDIHTSYLISDVVGIFSDDHNNLKHLN